MPTPDCARRVPADLRARAVLRTLLPALGPWTRYLLWHGIRDEQAPPGTPESELAEILAAGLGPTLEQYLATSERAVPVDVADEIRRDAFARQLRSHAAIMAALPEIDRLRERGLEFLVIKGPGVANAYRNALTRPFADLDILVRPNRFTEARRLLNSEGWEQLPKNRAPWPFFDRWCREGINLRDAATVGNIDLHHRPSPWLWSGRIDFDAVLARASPVPWFGREIVCASEADNLLVAALQLLSDHNSPGGKLLNWRDIGVLARRVEPAAAARIAADAGLADYLLAVLETVPLGVAPRLLLDALAESATGALPFPRRLAAVADKTWARPRLVMQIHARRLPAAIAGVYLLGTLLPSRAFIRQQVGSDDVSYPRWWRYALRHRRNTRTDNPGENS